MRRQHEQHEGNEAFKAVSINLARLTAEADCGSRQADRAVPRALRPKHANQSQLQALVLRFTHAGG